MNNNKKIYLLFILLLSIDLVYCQKVNYDSIDRASYFKTIERLNQHLNKRLPDLEFQDVRGKKVKLSEFRQKVLLIEIWATWCGPCVKTIPENQKTYNRLRQKGITDFEWINISIDKDTAAWRKMVEAKNIHGINIIGNPKDIERYYHMRGAPNYILVDNNRRILGFQLSFGPVLLDYMIIKGIEGMNCAEAYKTINIDGSRNASEEFKAWRKSYYNGRQ